MLQKGGNNWQHYNMSQRQPTSSVCPFSVDDSFSVSRLQIFSVVSADAETRNLPSRDVCTAFTSAAWALAMVAGVVRPLQRVVAAVGRHQLTERLPGAHAPDREFSLARARHGLVVVEDGRAVDVGIEREHLSINLWRTSCLHKYPSVRF